MKGVRHMDLRKELGALYYSTALCDLRLMNQKFVDQNITYNSLLYLELIHAMEGKATVSKMAEMLYVSKPAVSLKVNELIRQGLVVKHPDPGDHRQNLLSINEVNLPQYQIYRKQDDLAIRQIREHFSAEEIEKFCQMLRIITEINFKEIE